MSIILILHVKGQNEKCQIGCQSCNNQIQNTPCSQCYEGYQLQQETGICQYTQCNPNLYFQIQANQNSDSKGDCVSVCNPLYLGEPQTNLCTKKLTCSTSFLTQQNFINSGQAQDIFVYQNQYYIALQSGFLSVYNMTDMFLIKNLYYDSNDLKILNINGFILVISSNSILSQWEIVNEQRQYGQSSQIYFSIQYFIKQHNHLSSI
ncbi:kinase domain protein (macronuclear) [Tetrahymena thermophila SB210]|uniref:Kinase domain protein n=1 Tax=Tetrahymena thermophila (strain SB210) TaxID=312017 RepID=Q22B13_TETTS|nr:kinase domain protein [Tetrahymena thermophila SB210]EAR82495.2 kinase domain protein [Tetrahymena thermophila SB210]|eukprot:XP_001030158.2 kinase domain protein [Tetrahymena thermophila SB210]